MANLYPAVSAMRSQNSRAPLFSLWFGGACVMHFTTAVSTQHAVNSLSNVLQRNAKTRIKARFFKISLRFFKPGCHLSRRIWWLHSAVAAPPSWFICLETVNIILQHQEAVQLHGSHCEALMCWKRHSFCSELWLQQLFTGELIIWKVCCDVSWGGSNTDSQWLTNEKLCMVIFLWPP